MYDSRDHLAPSLSANAYLVASIASHNRTALRQSQRDISDFLLIPAKEIVLWCQY